MRRYAQLFVFGIILVGLLVFASAPADDREKADASEDGPIRDGRFKTPEENLPLKDLNLQRLVNQTPDGGVAEVPLGRYVIEVPLTVSGRKRLHVAFAPGTQLRCKNPFRDVIVIADCEAVKISGVRARHVKPLPKYECNGSVLRVTGSTDVHIDNCELNGCGAIGVFAAKSTLQITNCHIHHNTFNALYFSACEATVVGNIIEENTNMLQTNACKGLTFSDNLVRNNGGYWRKQREPGLKSTEKPDLRPVVHDD